MVSMEIGLSVGGVAPAGSSFVSLADDLSRLADAQDRVLANGARMSQLAPNLSETRLERLEDLVEVYERLAPAAAAVGTAARGLQSLTPAISDGAVARTERMAAAYERLAQVSPSAGAGPAVSVSGGEADALNHLADAQDRVLANAGSLANVVPNVPETRVTRLERVADAYERMAAAAPGASSAQIQAPAGGAGSAAGSQRSSSASGSAGTRFLGGPNQKLAKIEEQMAIAEAEGNQAALADLTIARARALRAKHAGEKLVNAGEEGITADGLLDIVGDIRNAIRAGLSGDIPGLIGTAMKGVNLLQERPGGLNIEQLLGGARGTRMIGGAGAAAQAAGSGPLGGGILSSVTLHAQVVYLHAAQLHGGGGGSVPLSGNGEAFKFDPERRGTFDASALRRGHLAMNRPGVSGVGRAAQGAGAAARTVAGASGAGATGAGAAAGAGGAAGVGAALAVLGPLAVAVGVTVGVLAVFTHSAMEAAAQLDALRQAAMVSGGTSQNISTLRAMGISPSQVAGAAGAFRQGLANDSLKAAHAADLGISMPLDRSYGGTVNEAQLFLDALEAVAFSSEDPMARLAKARQLDLDGFIPQIEAYRLHGDTMRRDAALMDQLTEKYGAAGTEFQYQLGRVGMAWESVQQAFSGAFLDDLAPVAEQLANAMFSLARLMTENEWAVEGITRALFPCIALLQGLGMLFETIPVLLGRVGEAWELLIDSIMHPDHAAANNEKFMKLLTEPLRANDRDSRLAAELRKNTQALEDNTAWLKPGGHGGGDRVRGALPADFSGRAIEKSLREQELIFGAFG